MSKSQLKRIAHLTNNQCDGCCAGIPVVNGIHYMNKYGIYSDPMYCTKDRYTKDRPDAQQVLTGELS